MVALLLCIMNILTRHSARNGVPNSVHGSDCRGGHRCSTEGHQSSAEGQSDSAAGEFGSTTGHSHSSLPVHRASGAAQQAMLLRGRCKGRHLCGKVDHQSSRARPHSKSGWNMLCQYGRQVLCLLGLTSRTLSSRRSRDSFYMCTYIILPLCAFICIHTYTGRDTHTYIYIQAKSHR